MIPALRHTLMTTLMALVSSALWPAPAAQANTRQFDFAHGNAPVEVIIPEVIPVIFSRVDPSDASLVLRATTLLTNAFFDAIAPWHPTAVGVYSTIPRRPMAEGKDDRARNIAVFYAGLETLLSLYPSESERWAAMMRSVGLAPELSTTDVSTPAGIGRVAAREMLKVREQDGMNQLGDANGVLFNRVPYADTTGYQPVNTAFELRDPSRWQPARVSNGGGIFRVQQFVTPQWGMTLPYAIGRPERYTVAPPADSQPGSGRYKMQADEVINASATLTDPQKMTAELFNNKIESLGFVALFLSQSRRWTVEQFVHYDFLVNLAAFDGGTVVWREKSRFDSVRPFSAIRHIYGDGSITAWGGPGRGTVEIPAAQWTSYLPVADHPEYPSASACFCAAHAQASRRFFNSDALGWTVSFSKGSSRIEPGVTPMVDTTLTFDTWTRFEQDCGHSRLLAGVHFKASIDASAPVCKKVGDRAFRFLSRLVAGGRSQARDEDMPD